jgi:hypothetical protein
MTDTILDFNFAKRQDELQRLTVDADDIRARLHADARGFVQWLYTGRALIHRNEARIGDVFGTPGASLSIKLAGSDAGLWKDHATQEGGDLIALYRAYMGYHGTAEFEHSLKEIAKDYFGDTVEVERKPWQPTPIERIAERKEKLGTKPHQDLVELGAPVATYKYFDTRGNVIASVVRYEPDGTRENKTFRPYCYRTIDGEQKWRPGAPDLRPLYRLPEISLTSTVVLVEGEGCAEALAQLGIEATSAMQGANAPIDKTDWSPLAGKTVVIWPDNDAPGIAYAKSVAQRLISIGCTVQGITPPADASQGWDAVDAISEGKSPQEIIATATPVNAEPRPAERGAFELFTLEELENQPPPTWLIDGIITETALSLIWGKSGSMKSFVAIDMGLHIVCDLDWHGHKVKRGAVVFVAAEGAQGLRRRAMGWIKSKQDVGLIKPGDAKGFTVLKHSLVLASDDLNKLIEAIKKKCGADMPVLIVIDTLARTFGAGNENQQADMNAYVHACDKLREATGANVMIVHHSGVHEDRRERGSNVLRGAADTVIKISRKDDKIDVINRAPEGKQKDFDEFKTVKLRAQKIGDGDTSTLVLVERTDADLLGNEPVEESEGGPAGRARGIKVGRNEKAVLKALAEAAEPVSSNRLQIRTAIDKRNLARSLSSLREKGLVITNGGLHDLTEEGKNAL